MQGIDSTALIVVDMQNAFVAPSNGLGVDHAHDVLRAVNLCVADAIVRGWPIFYTLDLEPTELPVGDPQRQTDLYPDLVVRGTVVPKGPGKRGGFSGFVLASTALECGGPGGGGLSDLAKLLNRENVNSLVIVGLPADVCVSATARDARRLGYDVTIPLQATAFVHAHPEGDQAALDDLVAAGVRLTGEPLDDSKLKGKLLTSTIPMISAFGGRLPRR
jgi:nicotinamidase/pyrazinamidase